MTKFFELLKKQPLFTAALAVAVAVLAVRLPQPSYWNKCVLRILMCGTTLFFLYLVSGEKTIFQSSARIGYTFKHLLGFLIVAFIMGLLGVFRSIQSGSVEGGVLLRLITLALMFLFACLFEELCFRAVLNDAIVYQFRHSKNVFVVSAVVSSLVFGVVHIIGSPVTNAVEWGQAVMKTLSCAVMGFAMLILYWKTRSVWAIGLVHALFDFLTSFGLIFEGTANLGAGSYVQAGKEGVIGFITLGVQTLISAAITLHVWKKVGKTIDFEAMRESW